jgi:hypothetical protein
VKGKILLQIFDFFINSSSFRFLLKITKYYIDKRLYVMLSELISSTTEQSPTPCRHTMGSKE